MIISGLHGIELGEDGLPKDICSVTLEQRAEFAREVCGALDVKYTRTHELDTADALVQRIVECIHWHSLNQIPVSASHLNRLYGRVAPRFGVKVSGLLQGLVMSGRIANMNQYSRKLTYVSGPMWREYERLPEFEDIVNGWTANIK